MISELVRKQLVALAAEKNELEEQLMRPEVGSDPGKVRDLSQRLAEIREPVEVADRFFAHEKSLAEAQELLADPELKDMAADEIERLEGLLVSDAATLIQLLIPKDPNDVKDAIIEIRPGTGGDEAGLFAAELMRAYLRFAETSGFATEFLSKSDADNGGIKEAIFEVRGRGAYAKFKFEGGVHRVQRVPVTESQGRIHTSAVSVVVLPKVEEKEFEIKESDLRFDVFRSSGPGGQSVNTTDSAVRVTHLPTGIVVSCQDEKSQLKNKIKALSVLRSRLAAAEAQKKADELGEKRLSQIGSGDRSDKIRTYNFPQDRVTDHRLTGERKSFSNLPGIMAGNLGAIVEALTEEEAVLRSGGNSD